MRLQITKSANAECFYVVKSVRINGKNSNKVVESLGNLDAVKAKAGNEDPHEWAKKYVESLNEQEKNMCRTVMVPFSESATIPKDSSMRYNCGYLFLEKVYNELKLPEISKAIARNREFMFNMNSVLSRLVFCRIIKPLSKSGTYEFSKTLLQGPEFELHDLYRALDALEEKSDYIQEKLYKNSLDVINRDTSVLYYDCTNYFFEIEEENEMAKYGHSKENRPLPIVEMGLFMDGSGIPLAFCINSGNTNEQITLKPLEERIMSDFNLSEFIICTDSGLSSATNKYFNSRNKKNYITTTSLKAMSKERSEKILSPDGWRLMNDENSKIKYNLDEIKSSDELREKYYNSIFYKEEWFKDEVMVDNDLLEKKVKRDISQRLIVTFSLKYKDYNEKIRSQRIIRAKALIDKGANSVNRKGSNDVRQYIGEVSYTKTGEVAENKSFYINQEMIDKESKYDGFYAVYTSLDQRKYSASKIAELSKNRWEIEECFRILKTEFKARPVYLQKANRIKAHFLTCYIALLILKIVEQKLENKYTHCELIKCLREMDLCKVKDSGYIPAYTRTNLTDDLHKTFGFRTDYEILSKGAIRKILSDIKNS